VRALDCVMVEKANRITGTLVRLVEVDPNVRTINRVD